MKVWNIISVFMFLWCSAFWFIWASDRVWVQNNSCHALYSSLFCGLPHANFHNLLHLGVSVWNQSNLEVTECDLKGSISVRYCPWSTQVRPHRCCHVPLAYLMHISTGLYWLTVRLLTVSSRRGIISSVCVCVRARVCAHACACGCVRVRARVCEVKPCFFSRLTHQPVQGNQCFEDSLHN
jgi:hypothetical protein